MSTFWFVPSFISYLVYASRDGSGLEVIKLFSRSTQLSTKFKMIIKTKIPTSKVFLALSLSDVVFIMLINVKMSTILTFMSRINFVLS